LVGLFDIGGEATHTIASSNVSLLGMGGGANCRGAQSWRMELAPTEPTDPWEEEAQKFTVAVLPTTRCKQNDGC
jgi:hypothetical protein